MKGRKDVYFVDADELIREVPDGATCYTSALSSGLELPKIHLDASTNAEINQKAWDETIDYYNRHLSSFRSFESSTGFNLWFFLNFRLYFELRNYKLRMATLAAFLKEYPDGRILSTDRQLAVELVKDRVIIFPGKKKTSAFSKLKRISQEFWYIFSARGSQKEVQSKTVIISKFEDHIDNVNRRFHLLEDRYDAIGVRSVFDMSSPLKRGDQAYSDTVNLNGILSNYFTSFSWIGKLRSFNKLLDSLYASLEKGIDSDRIIAGLIKKHSSAYLVYHVIYESFLKYFKKSTIDKIIISDENSPQTRSIVEAARQCGIQSFAFQHGTIHEYHPAYIFGKYNGVVPLPTKTFVWGQYYADLLINEGGYRPDQVVSSGRIPVYVRSALSDRIDTSRRVMVYASQPQRNPALRKRQLVDVISVAQSLAHRYQLVLRPHPREPEDDYFMEVARSVGFLDFVIDRQSDLKDHFECCYLLITSYSTVGMEFIPYYKPMIVLDYLKEDLIGYVSNEVGIPVYDQRSLRDALSQEVIEINRSAYDRYLNLYNRPNKNVVEDIVKEIQDN